jgi:hypothetical protein
VFERIFANQSYINMHTHLDAWPSVLQVTMCLECGSGHEPHEYTHLDCVLVWRHDKAVDSSCFFPTKSKNGKRSKNNKYLQDLKQIKNKTFATNISMVKGRPADRKNK